MNSVVLIGRLTHDPEVSYTPNTQTPIARFSLAVDRPVSRDKERQTDFIRITVFGKQAETVGRYLSKGRQAAIHGRIQTGSYKNKDGVTVYTTDVIADRVEFLGSKSDNGGSHYDAPRRNENHDDMGAFNDSHDDFAPGNDSDVPDSFQAAEDDMPF